MKIGIDITDYSDKFNGGKDQYLINLLEGFKINNFSDKIVIFLEPEKEEIFKKIIPKSQIILVQKKKYLISKILKKLGIIKSVSKIDDLIFKSFFYRKIKKRNKVDILFFPRRMNGFFKSDAITITIPHDVQPLINKRSDLNSYQRLKYFLTNKFYYYLDFNLRDYIIAISEYDKKTILTYFPNKKKKVVRIYNPIKFENINNICIETEEKYILAVNIIHSHKNILTLIKAFEKIKDKISHNLYLVGGKTRYVEELENYVKEKKLGNRVIFTGYLEEEKLKKIMKNADIYVNPSLFEGFGMTAIEAMILGVPTLVAKNTAMPEVTKGLCYYYNEVLNNDELAEKIMKIISTPPSQEELFKISKKIEGEYNYLKISKQYIEFFEKIYLKNINRN